MPLNLPRQFGGGGFSASDYFVDRGDYRDALMESLEAHVDAVRNDRIDGQAFGNLLTFYGVSGIGKTMLSERLESWLTGHLEAGSDWGAPPTGSHLAVRWNINDSGGSIDVLPLMLSARSALHGDLTKRWAAFDLAFAAYHASVRPGEALPTDGLRDSSYAEGFIEIMGDIASDLGVAALTSGLGGDAIRTMLRHARSRIAQSRVYRDFPGIGDLIQDCLSKPTPGNQEPNIAARVLWHLSAAIGLLEPKDRPIMVVFIDHFERVQGDGRRVGEDALNQMIAALPYALFVVTGRNRLDWHREERTQLTFFGGRTWPCLELGRDREPRPHLLGRLSDSDVLDLLKRRAVLDQLDLSDELIAGLVSFTGGWPIHVDAVFDYARELVAKDPGQPLTIEKLGGSIDDVVQRLLEDLPADERRLLQAACLLPFFDIPLVVAVAGQIDEGAAHRLVERSTVLSNPGSAFPHRVHDEIRRAVRQAGPQIVGGWSAADWNAAANRALAEAEKRVSSTRGDDTDLESLRAIALAVTVAAEYSLSTDWLVEAIRQGPSVMGLLPLVPPSEIISHPETREMVRFIEAVSSPINEQVFATLAEVRDSGAGVASSAALWRAYRFRSVYDYDSAYEQLLELVERFGDRNDLYYRQLSVTLTQARRFVDAEQWFPKLSERQIWHTKMIAKRNHGDLEGSIEQLAEKIRDSTSRRYQLEVSATRALTQARCGIREEDEWAALRQKAIAVGVLNAERDLVLAHALGHIRDATAVAQAVAELDSLRMSHLPSKAAIELLAVRALATGDTDDLRVRIAAASGTEFRSNAWIPVEMLIEEIGLPLPAVPTQWLTDPAVVRERWVAIYEAVIGEAG